MKRLVFVSTMLVLFSGSSAVADDKRVVPRVPAGKIAFHFVVNRTDSPGAPPNVVGYLSSIEGVDGPMFEDRPCPVPITNGCVENAFFTLRVRQFSGTRPTVLLTADPRVSGVILSGLVFDVYLDRTPDQTWDNPDSFTNGERIATFKESDLQAATTDSGALTLFSSELVDSKTFEYHGQLVSFRRLVPFGTTSTNFSQPDSGAAFGTAIAIGPGKRSDNDDDD